jgi:uncharacterized protein YjiS (DUF1127 family)
MTQLTVARLPAPSFHPIQAAFATLGRVRQRLAAWSARQRSRAQLSQLSDHELHDIGITRAQAFYEHEKPFWRG